MSERYFTNSEVSSYLQCRRSWFIDYVLAKGPAAQRLHPKRETGNVVHGALEEYYLSHGEADLVSVATRLIAEMRESHPDEEDEQSLDEIEKYSLAIVSGYPQWLAETGEDSDLIPLGAEIEVQVPMPGKPGIFLLGKLDARFLRERDNARVFVDHKVVQNFPDQTKWAHISNQFKFYMLLERMTLDEEQWSDGGVINMLRRVLRTGSAKPPFYQRHEVRHNRTELERFWFQLTGVIDEMLAIETKYHEGVFDPLRLMPNPTRDCAWRCDFYNGCQMMDDGSDWEAYVDVAFVTRSPLERYQQLGGTTT